MSGRATLNYCTLNFILNATNVSNETMKSGYSIGFFPVLDMYSLIRAKLRMDQIV